MNKYVNFAFLAANFILAAILLSEAQKTLKTHENGLKASDTVIYARYNFIELYKKLDKLGATNEPSFVVVDSAMSLIGIEHKDIVMAQMLLESGNFESDLSKANHNYFGMKKAYQRPCVALGERNGYAYYRNWVYSVIDYALWQEYYANDLSDEEYLKRLSNYASDKNYAEKVKKLAKSFCGMKKVRTFADANGKQEPRAT